MLLWTGSVPHDFHASGAIWPVNASFLRIKQRTRGQAQMHKPIPSFYLQCIGQSNPHVKPILGGGYCTATWQKLSVQAGGKKGGVIFSSSHSGALVDVSSAELILMPYGKSTLAYNSNQDFLKQPYYPWVSKWLILFRGEKSCKYTITLMPLHLPLNRKLSSIFHRLDITQIMMFIKLEHKMQKTKHLLFSQIVYYLNKVWGIVTMMYLNSGN